MMNAIKRAVSPKVERSAPDSSYTATPLVISKTPLTEYICLRLNGENLQLFALMFAEAIKNNRHAQVIPFENVYKFLGYDRYDNAVRQLRNLFKDSDLVTNNLLTGEEVSRGSRGPAKQGYLVSVRQFETMMLAAKTDEGARAREMMLDVKDAVQDFIKMEMENSARAASEKERQAQLQLEDQASQLARAEQDRAVLSHQLKNLRDAKSYLYAFHLFDNRYKCGITDNPDKRERQHQTSCPSGRMIHTVVIACKQSEKLMDSIMKTHGAHVRQEEYEIEGGEEHVRVIFDTIARVEESLHSVSFERYGELLAAVNEILNVNGGGGGGGDDELDQSVPIPTPPVSDPVIGPFSNSGDIGRALNTVLQDFIRDRCDIGASHGVHTDNFLEEFNRANPRVLLRSQTLSKSMDKMGFMPSKHVIIEGRERRGYRGLRLRILP